MRGNLNAATSRTGYSISTESYSEKVHIQFQNHYSKNRRITDSISGTHCKDLMGGASLDDITSAPLDHTITWNRSNDETAEMLAPKSTVHWVGVCANDHA